MNKLKLAAALSLGLFAALLYFWGGQAQVSGQLTTSRVDPTALARPASARPSTAAGSRASLLLQEGSTEEDLQAVHGMLSGRVATSLSRTGIVGAEVTLSREGMVHAVTTTAGGRFSFRAPEVGVYQLVSVTAAGFVGYEPVWGHSPIRFTARATAKHSGATILLDALHGFAGRVVDRQGEAVAGAAVSVAPLPGATGAAPQSTLSAVDGSFSLKAPSDPVLFTEHIDFFSGVTRVSSAPQEIVVQLRRRSAPAEAKVSLSGTVLLADGSPAADALVFTKRVLDRAGMADHSINLTQRVVSDADGHFEFGGLTAGQFQTTCSSRAFLSAKVSSAAPARGVVCRLRQGRAIRGRVVPANSTTTVSAYSVVVSRVVAANRYKDFQAETFFDSAGAFAIEGLDPGRYRVRALAYGFAPAVNKNVVLGEEYDAEIELVLKVGVKVYGQVLGSAAAQPLSGATVTGEGTDERDDLVPVSARTTTDEQGLFVLYGLGGGMQSIRVHADGHHSRILSRLDVGAGEDIGPVKVELTALKEGEEPKLELAGIGAALSQQADILVVARTIAGGGAAEAGLRPGDAILAVEGRAVTAMEFREAINLIRGPEDSLVTLTIRRRGEERIIDVDVTRRRIRS